MDLIETFGAKVGALSEAKPEKARKLLAAGFQANGLKNKLASKRASQSDKMLFQTVNKAMVNCLTKPQGNVMVSLFTPCEMLHPLGLHPYSCEGFSRILDHVTEKNMIVSLHSMGEDEMDKMVERHPDTKFVFAHPGEYGEFSRHMKRMKMSENCYLDLSGYGIFRHGMLRHAIDEVGLDRIIFGSDYPTCNPAMYLGGVLLDSLITDREKELIFAGNAKRLLKL